MAPGDLFLLVENPCIWKEHVLRPTRRSLKSHLVSPTERRFIEKTSSGALSERLCVVMHEVIAQEGAEDGACSQKPENTEADTSLTVLTPTKAGSGNSAKRI